MRRALARARDGKALDLDEATVLMGARGEALEQLMSVAARVRDAGLADAGRPGTVTYSRKVFIPLTRLCRDRCHYCTFATVPGRLPAPYLSMDEVLQIARDGAALGCKEALFTLGDRPEDRWDAARVWLDEAGYDSTLAYVRACAVAVLEETGLLPHLNPGVLDWAELQRLKPVAPSMGMILETTADVPAHAGSPDKVPAVRLRTLEDAGRHAIPFTTGLLVGIGEGLRDRAETVFAVRAAHRRHGHVQEVIVQNFRAKDDTAMRAAPDASLEEYLAAIAVTRVVMGPRMRVQAPPNLVDLADTALLLRAGVDDWGGVSPLTPDHVNPERPWPQVDALAAASAGSGFLRRERLTATRRTSPSPGSTRAWRRTSPPCAGRAVSPPTCCRWGCRGRNRTGASPRPAAPTCTPPWTRPAAPPTAARTSTTCTATGPRCRSRRRRPGSTTTSPLPSAWPGTDRATSRPRRRWRSSPPTGPTSRRSARWPTTCGGTPWATT